MLPDIRVVVVASFQVVLPSSYLEVVVVGIAFEVVVAFGEEIVGIVVEGEFVAFGERGREQQLVVERETDQRRSRVP